MSECYFIKISMTRSILSWLRWWDKSCWDWIYKLFSIVSVNLEIYEFSSSSLLSFWKLIHTVTEFNRTMPEIISMKKIDIWHFEKYFMNSEVSALVSVECLPTVEVVSLLTTLDPSSFSSIKELPSSGASPVMREMFLWIYIGWLDQINK